MLLPYFLRELLHTEYTGSTVETRKRAMRNAGWASQENEDIGCRHTEIRVRRSHAQDKKFSPDQVSCSHHDVSGTVPAILMYGRMKFDHVCVTFQFFTHSMLVHGNTFNVMMLGCV